MSSQSIAPEVQIPANISPRLKRKLDKHLAAKERKHGGTRINAGAKPAYAKHLARNSAAHIFKVCDLRTRVIELLDSPDARLRFEVIRYVWDRLEGKPFVAENPNAKAGPSALHQDNRLQLAIKNLVVQSPANKQRKSKAVNAIEAKQLEAPTIQADIVTSDHPQQDIDNT